MGELMKNKIKKVILLLLVVFTLTGCTKTLTDDNNVKITNDETGQALTSNILCLPEDDYLYSLYQQNESRLDVNLADLTTCENMKVYDSNNYNDLWVQIFVRPLAWLIIKLGLFVGNYGISVMIIGILIRLILLPFSIKSTRQQENMTKAQPKLEKIEKKYANMADQEAMMKKSQETLAVYKEYNINPMSSCVLAFIQLPLFFALFEAINRVPAIFENNLWKFQLGTTPLFGITHGNYYYVILIVLIVLFTVLTFMSSMNMPTASSEQAKQTKFMMIFMMVFIGIASFQLPSAIALYWVVTNAFSVIQTYIVKKVGK